jgi:hypothetical protein
MERDNKYIMSYFRRIVCEDYMIDVTYMPKGPAGWNIDGLNDSDVMFELMSNIACSNCNIIPNTGNVDVKITKYTDNSPDAWLQLPVALAICATQRGKSNCEQIKLDGCIYGYFDENGRIGSSTTNYKTVKEMCNDCLKKLD